LYAAGDRRDVRLIQAACEEQPLHEKEDRERKDRGKREGRRKDTGSVFRFCSMSPVQLLWHIYSDAAPMRMAAKVDKAQCIHMYGHDTVGWLQIMSSLAVNSFRLKVGNSECINQFLEGCHFSSQSGKFSQAVKMQKKC
jgi:hypothetical protein